MARRDEEEEEELPNVVKALDRRASTSSRTSSRLGHSHRASISTSTSTGTGTGTSTSTRTSRTNSSANSSANRRETVLGAETPSPQILSSPSVASSLGLSGVGILSPLRRELGFSRTPLRDGNGMDAARAGRRELARRLSLLAQRLSYGDNMEELAALDSQVNQIEQVLGGAPAGSLVGSVYGSPLAQKQHRPLSVETPIRKGSRSDFDGGPLFSSPASSLFRSRFSDLLSPTPSRDQQHEESDEEEPPPPKKGMTAAQASKVISEMAKLNDELATIATNLKARQEESDHIHKLLIERAERAAQRIIFLQNRITYLEQELQENDAELQHLRVCLKAVEIQMPPHPDRELQRCFTVFKDGYQALKRKRAHRSSMVSFLGYDSSIAAASPTR